MFSKLKPGSVASRPSSIVAPEPMPKTVDVLEHFFPDSQAVRVLRILDSICPPIVHIRRR